MRKTLLWDLPTRLFHWVFSLGFIAAFAISKLVGKRSDAFAYHMFIGLVVLVAIVLRMIWLFAGTRNARIASFMISPKTVMQYMTGVFTNKGSRHPGRNPASAYAAVVMVILMIFLTFTGIFASRGLHEAGDIHELISYLLLAVAIAHVLGIIIHTIRFKDPIALSMIDGRADADSVEPIRSSKPIVAIIGLVILSLAAWVVVSHYDAATRKVTLPGIGVVASVPDKRPGDFRRDFRDDD